MPELPEVETICRRLREGSRDQPPLVGCRISGCRIHWHRTLAAPTPRQFAKRIGGQVIRGISRRAKFLVFDLTRDVLLIHLRMSGALDLCAEPAPHTSTCRLHLTLAEGRRLEFRDPRKFGRVWLVSDAEQILAPLGPEPLARAFSARRFYAMLRARRRALKPLLLDQEFLAGLGNIYVDESLHRARLHPLTPANSLSRDASQTLWRSLRQVLRWAIRYNGTSFDGVYDGGEFRRRLRVYRRTGEPCPTCRAPIERILIGQRGTHFCPVCQPRRDG